MEVAEQKALRCSCSYAPDVVLSLAEVRLPSPCSNQSILLIRRPFCNNLSSCAARYGSCKAASLAQCNQPLPV